MRLLISLVLGLLSLQFVAQEPVLTFELDDEAGSFLITKETFTLTNTDNSDLAIFVQEKEKAYAFLFDQDFNIKKKIVLNEAISANYDYIVGYNYNDGIYTLIAKKTEYSNKYSAIKIDFDSNSIITTSFNFKFVDKTYRTAIQHKNKVILITSDKQNTLELWEYDNVGGINSIASFAIPEPSKKQRIYSYFGSFLTFVKIDNRVPNSIDQSIHEIKLYLKSDRLFLTLDKTKTQSTFIHIVDLNKLKLETIQMDYAKINNESYKRNNSFLVEDDILIQISANVDQMRVDVKNLEGEIKKTFTIDSNRAIDFANSPLYSGGSTVRGNLREVKTTQQFLKKIKKGQVGISGYKQDNEYRLSIGGAKIFTSGGGGGGFMPDGGVTGAGVPTYSFNPTFSSFGTTTSATYFNTNFDEQFQFIDKQLVESTIDNTVEKIKKGVKRMTAEDVFFYKSNVYFFFYDQRAKTFNLYKVK